METVTISLPEDVLSKMESSCLRSGVTLDDFVRQAVEDYIHFQEKAWTFFERSGEEDDLEGWLQAALTMAVDVPPWDAETDV